VQRSRTYLDVRNDELKIDLFKNSPLFKWLNSITDEMTTDVPTEPNA